MTSRLAAIFVSFALACFAAGAEPGLSAADLAAKLVAKQQDGTSHVRLRMEINGAKKTALQLQIKSRATRAGTDLVYQILWPKERKGEAVLLRKATGRPTTGVHFTPPDSLRPLSAAQMREPLFESDLSYEDVIDSFFSWEHQAIVGSEVVDRTACQILESKPGKDERSSYASVRTWVDPRRMVPLRIEKYGEGGKLVRRIAVTRILLDGDDSLPANLTVRGPRGGSVTELDGSRIKRSVSFADSEFTPEGLRELGAPRGGAE